jgi:GNAT superfamily N-acetyltransferase
MVRRARSETLHQIAVRFRPCRAQDLPALEWMGLHGPDRSIIAETFAAQERGTKERPNFCAVRVFPPLQGTGIGAAMMEAVERFVVEAGGVELELEAEPDDFGPMRFYESLGFVQARRSSRQTRNIAAGPGAPRDPGLILLRKWAGR